MEKKYELTDEFIEIYNIKLYRIKALISFNDIKEGDLGGYIEKEDNLSHKGNCWVYDGAKVSGDARVQDNACIHSNGCMSGNARAYDNACVCDNGYVCGNARVYDNACVRDNARVFGDVCVCGDSYIFGDACAYGNSHISGNARVFGNTRISGNVGITGKAMISDNSDFAGVFGFGSTYRTTTFFKQFDGSIGVACGCFSGTLEEFRNKVKKTHGDNKIAKQYLSVADIMESQLTPNVIEDN